ncbi:MAG: PstS family phosphate ABC transporter substrate-binding protein [Cyanophyceae cyanobacterium]
MTEQKQRGWASLQFVGRVVLAGGILAWSLALVGGGIWQLSRQRPQQTQPQQAARRFAQVQNVPTGLFSYGGSPVWAPLRLLVDSAIQSARPEFQLRYVDSNSRPPGSTTGVEMLLDEQLSFAQTARPLLEKEYEQAEQQGFQLEQIPVAVVGIAVVVHPSLDIPGLTLDQLSAIYRGQITNWQEVGGPNLEITPYSRPLGADSTIEFMQEELLQGQFGNNVELSATTTQALRKLAQDPGGIYYASAPEVVPQCQVKPLPIGYNFEQLISPYQEPLVTPAQCPNQRNQLNIEAFRTGRYPMTRYLYVVIKQNGHIEEQAGESYANFLLTPQGQELIAQAGFVRLR